MVKAGSGDYEGAISDLKRMTKSQVAKDILEVVGQTPEKM
jgi:hypothetical protein